MIPFFFFNHHLTLENKDNNMFFDFHPPKDINDIPLDQVWFDTPAEVHEFSTKVWKEFVENPISVIEPNAVQKHPSFPKDIAFLSFDKYAELFKDKEEIKIAIVNCFSHSIGDHLMGMTAYGYWYNKLQKTFKKPIKVMFFQTNPAHLNVITAHHATKIERLYMLPRTVADLCLSDFYIDLSEFVILDGFDKCPIVDFYLKALSINPEEVPPELKRNIYKINRSKLFFIEEKIEEANKENRPILMFHYGSSSPIRSMSKERAEVIINEIISKTDYFVISALPINVDNPRCLDISSMSKCLDDFAHIVSSADVLITVDTCSYHFSDAFSIPTVVLFSTIEPGLRTAYYPYVKGILYEEKEGKLYGRHLSYEKEDTDHLETLWDKVNVDEILEMLK